MGRPSLAQYVEDRPERLFHVGRLDQDTEGLILLSNDGELTHRLTHPSYEVPKTYIARVEGSVTRGLGKVLTRGVTLEDGFVQVDDFVLRESADRNSIVEITLHSGRNRIVRRIMEEVGHPVMELVRTRFGTIEVGYLKPGRTRQIAGTELSADALGGDVMGPVRIVGTGLLGASLGLRLRELGQDVQLEDTSPAAAALARELGAGDIAKAGSPVPSLVIVATPPDVAAAVVCRALDVYPYVLVNRRWFCKGASSARGIAE